MVLFVDYLQSRSVGEGAKSIYQRFKKVIRYAIEHDVILKDPCKEVICKVDDQMYNPQNEMFRLLGTKRSFSQNETFFFSHPYPPTLPFST